MLSSSNLVVMSTILDPAHTILAPYPQSHSPEVERQMEEERQRINAVQKEKEEILEYLQRKLQGHPEVRWPPWEMGEFQGSMCLSVAKVDCIGPYSKSVSYHLSCPHTGLGGAYQRTD